MLFSKSIAAAALLISKAAATIYYAGVSESSGEFGVWSATSTPGTGLPGRFGVDYAFINKTAIDVFVDQDHVNLFRVAFLLERMCPPTTGLGAKFNQTHFDLYADAINYITKTKGAYVILDPHNYMRYNDPSQQPMTGSVIGNSTDPKAATTKQFAEFWGELAGRFKGNERVIFGLMNEPHDMSTDLVLANDQAAIDAIRKAGAKQLWTGYSPSSATALANIKDPLNNTAIDIHEYLDADFSGSHVSCNSSGPANLADVTAWLKANKFKAIVSEFGAANGTQCASYLSDMINYMASNEEYIGWAAWAAGPFWGTNSACCSDGNHWGSLEPGSTAGDGGPSMYETVWLKEIQPLLPKALQWAGVSSVKGGVVSVKGGSHPLV
ncbi:hypothetical protein G7Y89_g2508 [Cudoniella acicularis]|uniref:cellulase n=1 Tax=Cudoniella acicularis TaxID=354080 RepID=A0A8H4RTB1_9HELO|nr:hypothetical protein G7Y89_g2508 [Cudoniella acicularis]